MGKAISHTTLQAVTKNGTTYTYSDQHHAFAQAMYEQIKRVAPYTPKPKFYRWANDIRKMHLIDKLPPAAIGTVFRWANGHPFWSTNILSPQKLRSQFARLHAEMEKANATHQRPYRSTASQDRKQSIDSATHGNKTDWQNDIR